MFRLRISSKTLNISNLFSKGVGWSRFLARYGSLIIRYLSENVKIHNCDFISMVGYPG